MKTNDVSAQDNEISVSLIGSKEIMSVPVLDYLDMAAYQAGYEGYEDMLACGCHIDDWTREKYNAFVEGC